MHPDARGWYRAVEYCLRPGISMEAITELQHVVRLFTAMTDLGLMLASR